MPDKPKPASASKTQPAGKTSASPERFTPRISELAQQFSEKSRLQAGNIEQALNSEFQRFGTAIRARLRDEQKKTESAIADHSRHLLSLHRWFSWVVMAAFLLVGVLIGAGVTWKLVQPNEWMVCQEFKFLDNQDNKIIAACRTR